MLRRREKVDLGVEQFVVTVPQAAETLGVKQNRVLVLIWEGKLPARKLGRFWLVSRKAVEERKLRLAAERSAG